MKFRKAKSVEQPGTGAGPAMHESVVTRSHSAIMKTARQWQLAVDSMADPIFLHDSDFRILRANKAYAREAGMPVADVIGKHYWEVFPRLSGPLPGCLRTLSEHTTEDRLTLEDGRVLRCQNYAVFADKGRYLFSVHCLQDVSYEQPGRQISTDLFDADRYLHGITDTMPDILFDFDPVSLAPLYVSSAVHRILGYEPDVFVQEPAYWLNALHPDDRGLVLARIQQAADARQDVMFECRVQHATSGEYICLEVRARSVTGQDGEVSRLIGIATDISDRQRMILERIAASERLNSSLIQSITAITSLMEKRDPYTAGHQRRVAAIAAAIAREMGLDEDRVSGLELGALVHDIGKICIPAEILNRPGKLTDAEFEIIKDHPRVGYDILKVIDFPWPIADMVLQHHERMDGSGYPNGLRGEAIILEARILAVADVYEATSAHRPYRPGHDVTWTIETVVASKGVLFDPQVVEAFYSLVEQGLLPHKPFC